MAGGCSSYRWAVEGVLAVSEMPCPETLRDLAGKFRSIVSLATWVEHAGGGYDPRLAGGAGVEFVWVPVGMYNAPSLPQLVRALGRVRGSVLVHGYRDCGRAAVYAAAYLMRRFSLRLPEALAQLSSRTGCSVETLPQLTVLKAYDYTLRYSLEGWVEGFVDTDASAEYLLLLSRELGVEPRPSGELWESSKLAASEADYTVAGVTLRGRERLLELVCWIERGAHPQSARRVGCPDTLKGLLNEKLKVYGVGVEVRNIGRFNVPWI